MVNSSDNIIRRLGTTGAFTDYFDEHGIDYICFDNLQPNRADAFVYGNIRTIECEDGDFKDENISLGLGYLDLISTSDVLVVKGSDRWAYFGELMSTLSCQRNLSAAVIIGKTRDRRFTSDLLPVWSTGLTPVDIKGRGRVVTVGGTLLLSGREVKEGMKCAADADGVVMFNKLDQSHIDEIRDILLKEQSIIELIKSGATVNEILEFTPSF